MLLPQGLCTHCSLNLECSSPERHMAPILTFFRFLKKRGGLPGPTYPTSHTPSTHGPPTLLHLNTQHHLTFNHSPSIPPFSHCLSVCLPLRMGISSCSLLSTKHSAWSIAHTQLQ